VNELCNLVHSGHPDSSFLLVLCGSGRRHAGRAAVLGVAAACTPDKTRRLRGVILDSDGEFERGTDVRRGLSQEGVSVFPLVLNHNKSSLFFLHTVYSSRHNAPPHTTGRTHTPP
jgi:hypothetical protein